MRPRCFLSEKVTRGLVTAWSFSAFKYAALVVELDVTRVGAAPFSPVPKSNVSTSRIDFMK